MKLNDDKSLTFLTNFHNFFFSFGFLKNLSIQSALFQLLPCKLNSGYLGHASECYRTSSALVSWQILESDFFKEKNTIGTKTKMRPRKLRRNFPFNDEGDVINMGLINMLR